MVKRPLMMGGIEGGLLFVLLLLGAQGPIGEIFGEVVIKSLIGAIAASVLGLGVGAYEVAAGGKPTGPRPPSRRERAKRAKETKEQEEAKSMEKLAPAAPAAAAPKMTSWADRALAGKATPESPPETPAAEAPEETAAISPGPAAASVPASVAPPADEDGVPEGVLPELAGFIQSSGAEPAPTTAGTGSAGTDISEAVDQTDMLLGMLDEQQTPASPQAPQLAIRAALVVTNPSERAQVRQQLSGLGCDVVFEAGTREDGLIGLLGAEPDLIVTDLDPSGDNQDYLAKVRRASQFALIVVYDNTDTSGYQEVAGRWEPGQPLDQSIRTMLGLP